MHARSSSGLLFLPILFLLLVGMAVLLLAQAPPDLTINSHAAKHGTQAAEIYALVLAGKCVASTTYCGGSEIEKLHVCTDPITGLVGAVIQFGDEIRTGFYEGNVGYWERVIERDNWEVCR